MIIFNTRVYGLDESLVRAGYPMKDKVDYNIFDEIYDPPTIEKNFKRATKLGHAPNGSGHDCFLKGINVQMDITAPQYWWQQAQRYHWFDIVSSMSKMHSVLKMDLNQQCTFETDYRIIRVVKGWIDLYKQGKVPFEYVLDNLPMGLQLTAGVTTNYLQIKGMYAQRKTHKLRSWNTEFKNWVEGLPHAKELGILGWGK